MNTTRTGSRRAVGSRIGRKGLAILAASVLLALGLAHGSAAAEGRRTAVSGIPGRLGVSVRTVRGALDPAKVTMGWRPVYHEHEFARRRALTARPESMVVVSLEAPRSRPRHREDSGGRPGVDEIPYHYPTTQEREFCWEGGTLLAAGPGAQPHAMVLRDARQRAVLRIEEGSPCVARTVPAGSYTMRLEAGSGRGETPDLVFIRPAGERAPVPAPPVPREPEASGPETSGVVCDDVTVQSDGSFLVACSQPLCTFAVNFNLAGSDLPGVRDALTPGQMAFVLRGPTYTAVFIDSPCENLAAIVDGFPILNWASYDYQFSLFPPDPQAAAYYYYNEANFRGPRVQLDTGDCLCQGAGCRDCSIRGESLDDPLWYYFICLIQGEPCDRLGVVDSSASVSIYNPQAPPDANILLSTKSCDDCVFAFSNALRGQDLRGASVQRSDFSQADLTGTALDGIDGEGALFHSVIAPGSTFLGAHLTDAMFTPLLVLIAGGAPDADSIAVYPPARLDGADLSGTELARADLSLAVLSSLLPPAPGATTCTLDGIASSEGGGPATLDGILAKEARFDGARLTAVPVRGADLRQASFRGAQAYAADFGPDGETSTILGGADFARADLSCASLEQAQGDPADGPVTFLEAKMSRAFLQYASLTQAIFSGAQLDPANLAFANLTGASFASRVIETPGGDVSLPAAVLEGSYMEGTILANADLTEAKMDRVAWFERNDPEDGCQGRPCATGAGAILAAAVVQNARLPHLTFSSATMMPGITLSGSSLSGAVLEGADLGPQGINQSILTGADLRAAKLTGASFLNVDLSGALVQPQTEAGVFGVPVPLDPGRYTAAVSTRCVHLDKTATATPVTGPFTTCPNGTSTAGGCGTIGPANGLWYPTPPPLPPIADC